MQTNIAILSDRKYCNRIQKSISPFMEGIGGCIDKFSETYSFMRSFNELNYDILIMQVGLFFINNIELCHYIYNKAGDGRPQLLYICDDSTELKFFNDIFGRDKLITDCCFIDDDNSYTLLAKKFERMAKRIPNMQSTIPIKDIEYNIHEEFITDIYSVRLEADRLVYEIANFGDANSRYELFAVKHPMRTTVRWLNEESKKRYGDYYFINVNRSRIVNIDYVKDIIHYDIIMYDGTVFRLSPKAYLPAKIVIDRKNEIIREHIRARADIEDD